MLFDCLSATMQTRPGCVGQRCSGLVSGRFISNLANVLARKWPKLEFCIFQSQRGDCFGQGNGFVWLPGADTMCLMFSVS